MKNQCHACKEEILEDADICKHCGSSQRKVIYHASSFTNLGSFVISLMAVFVSVAALYFSRVTEPATPRLAVQIDSFNQSGFSFLVTNLGELPTVVRDFNLTVSLQQGGGAHAVEAGFSIPPRQIASGESQLFQVEYSTYVPRYTRWTADEGVQEPFTLNFLYGAAGMGNNLHCAVDVYFTSRRYFPSNIDGAEGSVSGTCSEAMKWFAENIGPLTVHENSE
ncbi:MAG: hypothetical protein ACJAQU_001630 [Loktanella salsilacus]|jgi:hypothetical protein